MDDYSSLSHTRWECKYLSAVEIPYEQSWRSVLSADEKLTADL